MGGCVGRCMNFDVCCLLLREFLHERKVLNAPGSRACSEHFKQLPGFYLLIRLPPFSIY